MKRALAGQAHLCIGIISFLTFPLVYGTFSLFQGNAYSNSVPRQRNKNWCAFVVHKTVSCAVHAATESVVDPQLAPCPPHLPECAQRMMYHTRLVPVYKVAYKQVTELEWRCCPGFQGHDCTDLKDAPPRPHVLQESQQDPTNLQQQSVLGPEVVSGMHPWTHPGQSGQSTDPSTQTGERQQESRRVKALEEEVERLSQTVLDLQAAMTSATANLRVELQEDASKIFENMLANLQKPQDAKTGGTVSILFPHELGGSQVADELQNQVTNLSNTISTNTNDIQGLSVKIQNIDEQLHRLTEASSTGPLQPPSTASTSECSCQTYVDEKISDLRMELLEGMDIKISDMKNACDYKISSVQEQCEEQEISYSSLAELIDSKEADLRKEIQDLHLLLPNATSPGLDNAEVQKFKDDQQVLTNAISHLNTTLAQIDVKGRALGMRVSLAEKTVENCCKLEEKMRRHKEQEQQNIVLEELFYSMQPDNSSSLLKYEQRLEVLEKDTEILQGNMGSLSHQMMMMEILVSELNHSRTFESHDEKMEIVNCGQCQEQVTTMNGLLNTLDRRVANIENVCGRFEPMSDSLRRIKDGLNKHVNGLWTCVRHLNSTVLTHTRDINTFKDSSRFSKDRQDGITTQTYTGVHESKPAVNVSMEGDLSQLEPPVIMSGEAGPPGPKITSQSPQGTPVTGYAGAPGYPLLQSQDSVSAQIPLRTVQMATGDGRGMTRVSFSAGLTLLPFPGEIATIRFNNVLLNDGGHYDPKTGVFIVPVDGRYLLSAVLTAQTGERVEAFLSVANRNIQKLYTAGVGGGASEGCVCGGSASVSLALHLKRGQRVGLVLTSGKLALSASNEILSSFSGVLLYPTVAKR
nr:EMILIN-2 isoform X1 [Misgurnus anguillicaudatus]